MKTGRKLNKLKRELSRATEKLRSASSIPEETYYEHEYKKLDKSYKRIYGYPYNPARRYR